MKRILKKVGFLALMMASSMVMAADINPTLLVDNVKVIKAQERDGDELYFSISVYRPGKETEYFRVPQAPEHWPSQMMNKVKMVKLWSEPLKDGESVNLVVSLVDSDDSVINPDDLIGSIRVKLSNRDGVLHTEWVLPNTKNKPLASKDQNGEMHNFTLMDNGGDYEVFLSLENH